MGRQGQEPLRAIEDANGEVRFRAVGKDFLALSVDERRRIHVRVEAAIGTRDVVGDDEIDAFPLKLVAAARYGIAALGGETNQHRPRLRSPTTAKFGEDVRRANEAQFERTVGLFNLLCRRAAGRRVVGHRGSHDDDIGLIGDAHDGIAHFVRAANAHHFRARRRLQLARP